MSGIPITQGTGTSSVATETIATVDYQKVKIVDGTAASTNPWKINSDGSAQVSVVGTLTATISGSPSISGAVTVVGTPSISGSVNIPNTVSVAGAVQIAGNSPASIAAVQRLDVQIIGSTLGLVTNTIIHGLSSGGGGGYVDIKVNPSGALTVDASNSTNVQVTGSVAAIQSGAWNASVSGTVGASIIGLTPVTVTNLQGASVSGTVNATQGTTPWTISSVYGNISGSVVGFQGGAWNINTVPATRSSLISGAPSVITGTASVLVIAAAPAAQRNYITQVLVTNAAATAAVVSLVEPGGSVIYSGYAAASGGGFSATFPSDSPLKQPTSVLALHALSSAAASILVSASGYTAA